MRIALVTENQFPQRQTISRVLCHLLDYLQRHGHSSLVIAPEGAPKSYGGTRIIPGEQPAQVKKALADFRPDVVHVLQPLHVGIEALAQARNLSLPVVASYHSTLNSFAKQAGFDAQNEAFMQYFSTLHDQADLSLVPSYLAKIQLKAQGLTKMATWKHGVDCDLFSPKRRSTTWRKRMSNGEPDKPIFIYAGELRAEKHVELLKLVIEENPDCRLAIAGTGSEASWLQDYFVGTPTVVLGHLEQGELAEAYASADAFIYPACDQITGTSGLEAMASGLPVLAPHCGDLLDFAVHGENALLFMPGNTEQAGVYLRAIVQQPRLKADLSRIARQTALDLSWEITLGKLLGYYEKVIKGQSVASKLQISEAQLI
jgi:glycosyltransferase involved in cell wall biosynthesis